MMFYTFVATMHAIQKAQNMINFWGCFWCIEVQKQVVLGVFGQSEPKATNSQ
jgi:hypothetical protein